MPEAERDGDSARIETIQKMGILTDFVQGAGSGRLVHPRMVAADSPTKVDFEIKKNRLRYEAEEYFYVIEVLLRITWVIL